MSYRVYLESLGCKLNQCERDALAAQFVASGHVIVSDPSAADLCVVNTCAVTHVAARKSRQLVRRLRRLNPSARLVVTGCSTGLRDHGLDADLLVCNDDKDLLPDRVERLWGAGGALAAPSGKDDPRSRTRPLVKIQDGCDNACTYCIVRILRGKQRSRPRQEVLAEVCERVAQGAHEIVLTGVHVGAYGRDIGEDLPGLVRAILDACAPDRVRLSSIEPWDLDRAFFDLWRDPRLCRHLHLPLQSGCDATLARMNRNYTSAQFAALVASARDAIPDLAVTTDVIVGFPGETSAEFEASAAFVEGMDLARIHVFPYSPRPQTPAAGMPGQIDPRIRRSRAQTMQGIARESSRRFRSRFVGRELTVLLERRAESGLWSGLTDNYIRVYTEAERDLANTLCEVRLDGLRAGGMHGTRIEVPGRKQDGQHRSY
jgi:threonylcarbamoyladenosine tRNA methylthiotransferase MtaB